MPRIRFSGFPRGQTVSLTATQGGESVSRTVASWNTGASLTITAHLAADVVAPAGVFLEARIDGLAAGGPTPGKVYDPSFHEIHYLWDVDDPGSYAAPEKLPAEWNDRSVKYGRNVSHVFRDPGTYQVRCTATDRSGAQIIAKTEIVVQDPDILYGYSRTILIDPAGQGDLDRYPRAQVATTLNDGLALARQVALSCRMLLRRGVAHGGSIRLGNGYTNHLLIGGYGDGAPPQLTDEDGGRGPIWVSECDADLTISSIDFVGSWDPTTETGLAREGIFVDGNFLADQVTVFDCGFSGRSICIYPAGVSATMVIEEVTMTDWADYGIFGRVIGNLGVAGCRFAQNSLALGGGKQKGEPISHNQHGPVRLSDCSQKVYLGQLDLYTNTGWSPVSDGQPAHQPCIRWNSNGARGGEGFMDRMVAEGGFQLLAVATQDGSTPTNPANVVIDKVLAIGTFGTVSTIFRIDQGGTTLRNAIAVMPNVPNYGGGSLDSFIITAPVAGGQGNADEPVAVYNCTFVNLLEPENDRNAPLPLEHPNFALTDYFATYTIENNVFHAPNASPPATTDAPLDATPILSPRSLSHQWAEAPIPDLSYATPSGSVATFRPLPGSAAIGDGGIGISAIDDFFGALRGAEPSRGATEPS